MRLCRHAIAQGQLDSAQNGLLIVVENQGEDLHHLPVAPCLPEQMLLQPLESLWQFDKRRAVPQGARLALDHRQIVAPIVNCPTRLVM